MAPTIAANNRIPKECRLVSVLKDSPAERAGLKVGDILHAVNGVIPTDASAVSELVSQSPTDLRAEVLGDSRSLRAVQIQLNPTRPRLGASCDLTGLQKIGLTAAGNESLTLYDGPYSVSASGIIDKKIVFARVRIANNSDHALAVGPDLFSARDGQGAPMTVLTPKQVMCDFYGDKGAHLLALKRQKKESLEANSSPANRPDESCGGSAPAVGRLAKGDNSAYLEANAEYLAAESLWPGTYAPGQTADGLIYLPEPAALPVTLTVHIEGRTFEIPLGHPQASTVLMKATDLEGFFEAQQKGTPIHLTLRKGRVYDAKFLSYDSDNEKVWFYDPAGGLLNNVSFALRDIAAAETIEQLPAKPK